MTDQSRVQDIRQYIPEFGTNEWGFVDDPGYTPFPNDYCSFIKPKLSASEAAVCDYLIHRLLRWQKQEGVVSIDDMVSGRPKRDERGKPLYREDGTPVMLDFGTGCSRASVFRALAGLADLGLVERVERWDHVGGRDPNLYRLRLRSRSRGSQNETPPPVSKRDPMGVSKRDPMGVSKRDPLKELERNSRQQPQLAAVSSRTPAPNGVVVASTLRLKDDEGTVDSTLLGDLVDLGVSKNVAKQLIKSYPEASVLEQIAALAFRTTAKEPAAVLVQAIKEDWALPKTYRAAKQRDEQKRMSETERAEAERAKREAEQARQDWKVKVEAYLVTLSAEDRQALEAEAEERILEAEGGSFWKGRAVPKGYLGATLRTIAAERMGLPPLPDEK